MEERHPIHDALLKELSQTPDEKESIHDPEEQRETEFTMGPPLTVLTSGPGGMDDRRIIPLLLERLVPVAIPMEIDKQLGLVPLSRSFNTTELPFPQRRLSREATQHDGHLQCHEHAEEAQDHDEYRKDQRDRLPGEEKADRSDEDGVRRQIT